MSTITVRPRLHFAHFPETHRRTHFRRRGMGLGVGPTQESAYLRRWVTHQATTYRSLLLTIAAAPRAERSEASI